MKYMIITTALAIVLFVCAFEGFKQGLRVGMQTAKKEIPKPIKSPIKVVREAKDYTEQSKEAKKFNSNLEKMMNYTGDVEEDV